MGVLRYFHKKRANCPHILISTHYQHTSDFLPGDAIVEYLKMSHSEENGALLFLYKIEKGISKSFALNIASEVGLDPSIIRRAKELSEENKTVKLLVRHENFPTSFNDNNALISFLRDVNIPEPDLEK